MQPSFNILFQTVSSIFGTLFQYLELFFSSSASSVAAFKNRLFQFKSVLCGFMCNAQFLFLPFHLLVFY